MYKETCIDSMSANSPMACCSSQAKNELAAVMSLARVAVVDVGGEKFEEAASSLLTCGVVRCICAGILSLCELKLADSHIPEPTGIIRRQCQSTSLAAAGIKSGRRCRREQPGFPALVSWYHGRGATWRTLRISFRRSFNKRRFPPTRVHSTSCRRSSPILATK